MSAVLIVPPYLQFFDANGDPLVNGKIYTYVAGTSTPKATYTDESANTPATNPVILDAAGRTIMWGNGSYKFVVKDSSDNVIETTDDVTVFSTASTTISGFFQSFSGNGSATGFTLSQDFGTDSKALMIFVDDGGTKGYDVQDPSAYTINGTSLTFAIAPASGTNNIYVFAPSTLLGLAATYADAAQAYADAANTSATDAAASEVLAASEAATATTQAGIATTQAGTATTQAGLASTYATNSFNSASSASTYASNASASAAAAALSAIVAASTLTATSTTSNTIGTGSFNFTIQTNKQFQAGQFVTVSNGSNYIFGSVTSYNSGTGALVINGTSSSGSGTFSSWNISISGIPGQNGAGTGTVTSISVATANGLAGSVASATTTPVITLSTSVTGILKGNGTAISAASSGTDYAPATSGSNFLKGNGSGGFTNQATIALSDLATQAANTFVANATSGSVAPTASVALNASELAGRGSSGNLAAISLGTGLSMSGTTLNSTAGSLQPQMTVFTASGTFTTSANITAATVFKFTVTGGGGGGGGGGTGAGGGGGGSGATAIYVISGLSASTGYSVTVGAAGTNGSGGGNGGSGGTSSIVIGATTVSATGGGGGIGTGAAATSAGVNAYNGGTGGTATNGTINSGGGGGVFGIGSTAASASFAGGSGGASFWGQGGRGGSGTGGGTPGTAYGSGGGGGSNASGSAGKAGIVVVEWQE